ncbi:gustatory and pheromone receptor 39a [Drosophila tropicalis]|uniref:gustatory and pheromone receptor 39a n=1 Tax=Drosophila tropicalis TaxID=46794 RepID=UPI0035ABF76E
MPQRQPILRFLHFQRYLGLTNLEYSNSLSCYQIKANWCSLVIQLAVQGTLLSVFLATITKSMSYLETKSKTGDIFDHLVILAAPVTQTLANFWFHCHQETQLTLVQRMGQIAGLLHVDTLASNQPRWFFRLWLGVCFYYIFNVLAFAVNTWSAKPFVSHALALIGFILRMLCSNYIITCYASLVCVLKQLFQAQANQLNDLVTKSSEFVCLSKVAHNLRTHDELVLLSQREMVEVYGGTLLFPILYLVLDATSIIYASTLQWRHTQSYMAQITIWLTPLVLYLSIPMVINDLANQANKTAKILSKIPRTGTGLDRMVEKFLLKNLRQQPILTAYGFFALDKSTLFNLFTAIFTYMVILVQFKEMENSTKAIQRGTAAGQHNFTQQ